MNKNNRQFAIKEIIQSQSIANQEDLCGELRKRKFHVTQATLSRDLKALGVTRIHSEKGFRYALSNENEEQKIKSLVGLEIKGIDANEATIVVRTLPGRAQGVASFIDSFHSPDILGTVAGDDTVLVLPSSVKKTGSVLKTVRRWMLERIS
jgi:transcriptional regulator of arginine metabolism